MVICFTGDFSFRTLLHTIEKLVAIVLTSGEPSGGTLRKAESVSASSMESVH